MTSSVMTRMPRSCAASTKRLKSSSVAVGGMHRSIVGDVVAVVAQRRGIERQQPDRRHAERLDVVEPFEQAGKVADAVAVGVAEGLDVQLIDDGVAVPFAIGALDDAVVLVSSACSVSLRSCTFWRSEMLLMVALRLGETPDHVGVLRRVEQHVLHLSGPGEAVAGDHILDLDRGIIVETELPQRHLEVGALRVVRIEVDGKEQEVAEIVRRLAVVENVVVPGVVEFGRWRTAAAPARRGAARSGA